MTPVHWKVSSTKRKTPADGTGVRRETGEELPLTIVSANCCAPVKKVGIAKKPITLLIERLAIGRYGVCAATLQSRPFRHTFLFDQMASSPGLTQTKVKLPSRRRTSRALVAYQVIWVLFDFLDPCAMVVPSAKATVIT